MELVGHNEVLRIIEGQNGQTLGVVPQRNPGGPAAQGGRCRARSVWAGRRGGGQLETWRMAQATLRPMR